MDGDVFGRLQDQIVVVVAGRQHRWPHRPEHAAVVQIEVGPDVGRAAGAARVPARVLLPLRGRRQRRNTAVGRVDDDRGPPGGGDARVQPEVVVVAGRAVLADVHVVGDGGAARRPRQQLGVAGGDLAFEAGHLVGAEQLSPRELRGPLERRDGLVGIGALEVGVTPRSAGHRLFERGRIVPNALEGHRGGRFPVAGRLGATHPRREVACGQGGQQEDAVRCGLVLHHLSPTPRGRPRRATDGATGFSLGSAGAAAFEDEREENAHIGRRPPPRASGNVPRWTGCSARPRTRCPPPRPRRQILAPERPARRLAGEGPADRT